MRILKTFLPIVLFSLGSLTLLSQTFTYIDKFEPEENDATNNMCIAVSNGKIYVLDNSDSDVDVYSTDDPYSHLHEFGDEEYSHGITINNGLIFIAEDSDSDIDVFKESDRTFVESIQTDAERIAGIIIAFGKLFVVDEGEDDTDDGSVFVYSASSPYDSIAEFGSIELSNPSGITQYGQNIFVADDTTNNDMIHVYNGNTYAHIGKFGEDGSAYFDGLATVCNYILALDDSDDEVDVYSAESPFSYISSFGGDRIDEVECIAVDGNMIYVAEDSDADGILIYELEEGCVPIPTMSQWGMAMLFLVLIIFGILQIKYFMRIRSVQS